ncbi:MAG TPA: AAA family ATPase [Candidatus Wallbacteria bacterium]|nr:AAA family ATPase [Candidatus Wallbacteria bacterium]
MNNIIIIGKMGAGKDTLAEILVKNYGYTQTSIAGRLKQIAELLYADVFAVGDRNQKRVILQKLGDLLRSQNINIFNEALIREIETKKMGPVVISDVRYSMEYDFFVSRGFIPVKISIEDSVRFDRLLKRDGSYPSIETLNHKSENDICATGGRLFIEIDNNGGVDALEKNVAELVENKIINYLKLAPAETVEPACRPECYRQSAVM